MTGLLPRRKLQIWISLCKSFKIQLYNLEASCLHITIIFIVMCVECCDKQCGTSLKWNVRDVKSSCQVEDIFLCLLIKHILISIISIWYLNIIISAEGGKVDAWRSVMLSRVVLFTLDRGKRSENYQNICKQDCSEKSWWKSIKTSATAATSRSRRPLTSRSIDHIVKMICKRLTRFSTYSLMLTVNCNES